MERAADTMKAAWEHYPGQVGRVAVWTIDHIRNFPVYEPPSLLLPPIATLAESLTILSHMFVMADDPVCDRLSGRGTTELLRQCWSCTVMLPRKRACSSYVHLPF